MTSAHTDEKKKRVNAVGRLAQPGVRSHGIFRAPGGAKGNRRFDPYEDFQIAPRVLAPETARILYEQFWPARNVADAFAEDMTRGWFSLVIPEQPALVKIVEAYLSKLKAQTHFHSMVLNEAIYGDGAIALGIKDGRAVRERVDEDNIETIEFLHSFGRPAISNMELDKNLFGAGYGRIQQFELQGAAQSTLTVDASRILHLQMRGLENEIWGNSLFLPMLQVFLVLDNAEWTIGQLIYSLVFKVLKSDWEFDNVEQEAQAQQQLEKELTVLSTYLLGKEEELSYAGPTGAISGVDSLLNFIWEAYAGAARMPKAHLIGQPQGTITGASWDTRRYFDRLAGLQESYLRELIEKLIRYILLARDGGALTVEAVQALHWEVKFNSLLVEDATEQGKRDLIKAQTAQVLIDSGVASPGELRAGFAFLKGMETPLESLLS